MRIAVCLPIIIIAATVLGGAAPCFAQSEPDKKKIVFLAGRQSHGWSAHSFFADCTTLADAINAAVPGARAVVIRGWPKDPAILADAAAIIIACDGNSIIGSTANYKRLDELARQGVGLGFIHYALDVGKERGAFLIDWIGGYYEQHWSVNPHWTAEFKELPDHPITRGVRPFAINDEWYYHMRFRENMEGVTPILTAIPPERTRQGGDGAHSGNPTVRSRTGVPEHVMWCTQRPDGGRGFGFTGGHTRWNYASDNFRKLLVNAVCWTARIDIPADGIPTPRPTVEQMEANLEGERPAAWTPERTAKMIENVNR
jgi:type 1 glutamine amidotransferase